MRDAGVYDLMWSKQEDEKINIWHVTHDHEKMASRVNFYFISNILLNKKVSAAQRQSEVAFNQMDLLEKKRFAVAHCSPFPKFGLNHSIMRKIHHCMFQ